MTESLNQHERLLLMLSSQIAIRAHEQCETLGLSTEDVWTLLALAASAAERGVIETCRHFNNLKPYADAQARLARVTAESNRVADAVDQTMRERSDPLPKA